MAHPRRHNSPPPLPFSRKLVPHRWLPGLFGVERFDRLAEHPRDESLEGLDEGNVLRFHHVAFQEETRVHTSVRYCAVSEADRP